MVWFFETNNIGFLYQLRSKIWVDLMQSDRQTVTERKNWIHLEPLNSTESHSI